MVAVSAKAAVTQPKELEMPNNNTDARHQEALRLRQQGMSYGSIARALGYGNYPSAARYAVMAALRNQVSTSTSEDRQFGVEAEFYNITVDQALEALRAVGINVTWEGYTHAVMDHWKIVKDGSVSSRGTGLSSGLELVSPILKGEAGLQELAKALDALHNAGAKTNTTCGLHVHVDTAGMNGVQRKNFFNSYVRNQRVLDRLVSASRRNNHGYTKPYTESRADQYANLLEQGSTGSDRYYTVNTLSFAKYGTLEFRQHQGTVSGKKAVAWVQLLLGMAQTAQSTTEETVSYFGSVTDLLEGFGIEGTTKAFLLRREAVLNRQSVAA